MTVIKNPGFLEHTKYPPNNERNLHSFKTGFIFQKMHLKDARYFNNKYLMFLVIGKSFINLNYQL